MQKKYINLKKKDNNNNEFEIVQRALFFFRNLNANHFQ